MLVVTLHATASDKGFYAVHSLCGWLTVAGIMQQLAAIKKAGMIYQQANLDTGVAVSDLVAMPHILSWFQCSDQSAS